jgi:hypothetical protein
MIAGIDPGVNTGLALYDTRTRELVSVKTLPIHQAMEIIAEAYADNALTHVYVEDARLIKLPAHLQRHKGQKYAQGVGSVKRDCKIWDDFLTDLKIPHTMVDPRKTVKKMESDIWMKVTGWKSGSSVHSRDAAMLVWGR